MTVIFYPKFLNNEECSLLNAWVNTGVENKWLDAGMSRGSGWTYKDRLTTRNYGYRFEYPQTVYNVFDKISNLLKIQHLPKSVAGSGKDGVVVSYTLPGGDVYKHKDPFEEMGHVLRCNIMTQAADEGAELYIDGRQISIGVGDLHCYLPSDVEHYVTEVKGTTPRIMWMFGYQISKNELTVWQLSTKQFDGVSHG